MVYQLSEDDVALIKQVLGHDDAEDAFASDIFTSSEVTQLIRAARSEGPHSDQSAEVGNMVPHPESGEVCAWRARSKRKDGSWSAWWFSEAKPDLDDFESGYGVEIRELVDRASPPPLKGEALPVEEPVLWIVSTKPGLGKFYADPETHARCIREWVENGWDTQPLYARPVPGVSREEVARIIAQEYLIGGDEAEAARRIASLGAMDRENLDRVSAKILAILSRGEG